MEINNKKVDINNLRLIEASAGTGKTYNLVNCFVELVANEGIPADRIVATTFTKAAASELKEKISKKLVEMGKEDEAIKVEASGLIGTVHSVCGQLLSDFAIEAGLSPTQNILDEDGQSDAFQISINQICEIEDDDLNQLIRRMGLEQKPKNEHNVSDNWTDIVRKIADASRANNINLDNQSVIDESIQSATIWFNGNVNSVAKFNPPDDKKKKSLFELAKAIFEPEESITPETIIKKVKAFKHEIEEPQFVKFKQPKAAAEEGTKYVDNEIVEELTDFCEIAENFTWPSLFTNALKLADKSSDKYGNSKLYQIAFLIKNDFINLTCLQADILNTIKLLFSKANQSVKAYENYKTNYQLLDFNDLEVKALNLLKKDSCNIKIKERIKWVLVDEFQDTNPMQLAIFKELEKIADNRMIWVGDPKQAIFAFRGSCPELMIDESKKIPESQKASLNDSWRSKKVLIDFTNRVFDGIFDKRTYKGDYKLHIPAGHENEANGGEIEVWYSNADKKEEFFNKIASRIKSLPDECKNSTAILVRSDKYDSPHIVKSLNSFSVPVSGVSNNILNTYEGLLLYSAYRFAIDNYDLLALTNIMANMTCRDTWLNDIEAKLGSWKNDCDLENLGDVSSLTPLELLDKLIVCFNLDRHVLKLGNINHRNANIDKLRSVCRSYEQQCRNSGCSLSHQGFVDFLQNSKPKESGAESDNSITVCTYHAAKGLEWDTVILSSLDDDLKSNPFNLKVIDGNNPDNPLDGRKIRIVPLNYGKISKSKKTLFEQNKDIKEAWKEAEAKEIEEKKRLMYVGMTRAKNRLILAKKKSVTWLDDLLPGEEKWDISKYVDDTVPTIELNASEKPPIIKIQDTQPACSFRCFMPFKVNPSKIGAKAENESVKGKDYESEDINSNGFMLISKTDHPSDFGDCVHNYLAICMPERKEDLNLADRLIKQWGVEGEMEAGELVMVGQDLLKWIDGKYPGAEIMSEVPIAYNLENGQYAQGYIDLLLKAEEGYVILDHKIADRKKDLTEEYKGQLELYKMAVEAAGGDKVIGCYLHVPNQGRMIEVIFQ